MMMRICTNRSSRVTVSNPRTINDFSCLINNNSWYGDLWLQREPSSHLQSNVSYTQLDKFFAYVHSEAVMAYPTCDRFGEIQSLRTRKEGIYRLLMAAKLGRNTVKM